MSELIIFNNDNSMMRKMTELCLRKRRFTLNPIVDWSDDDVWEFITAYHLPLNPLYGMGWKRVGCIGCPLSSNGREELDKFPKYKAAYVRAAERHIKHKQKSDRVLPDFMKNAETYFTWWLWG
jgi:phosphoadenosine phosphosulfate reductase